MNSTTKFDKAQLVTLYTRLASLLGGTVRLDADQTPHKISLGDERILWVNYDPYKHRLNISGCWPFSRIPGETHKIFVPRDLHPQQVSPEISVAADRVPETLAADIQRRFLPEYIRVLGLCQARRDVNDAWVVQQAGFASRVATVLGVDLPKQSSPSDNFTFGLPNESKREYYGSIRVSGTSTSIEVRSLKPEQALKVIEFLKTI